jgi:hypothetical protein
VRWRELKVPHIPWGREELGSYSHLQPPGEEGHVKRGVGSAMDVLSIYHEPLEPVYLPLRDEEHGKALIYPGVERS